MTLSRRPSGAMDTAAQPRRQAPSRWLKPIVGIAVSVLFLWLAFRSLSMEETWREISGISWSFVPWAVLSLGIGYSARIVRWWVMLRPSAAGLRVREAAGPFLVSIAANNVLPLRVGDVLRLFAFAGRPGLEAGRVGGTLLVERLLDLLVLLAIFAIVLPLVPAGQIDQRLVTLASWAAGLGAAAIGCLFLLPMVERLVVSRIRSLPAVQNSSLVQKAFEIVAMVVETIVRLGRPMSLLALVGLSIIAWIFEGGVFLVAAHATGVPLGIAAAYFVLAVATLSTLLPSSPGYVGTFHFFAIQSAVAFGALEASAAAFAVLAHLLLWLPTTLAGSVAFMVSSLRFGQRRPGAIAASGSRSNN